MFNLNIQTFVKACRSLKSISTYLEFDFFVPLSNKQRLENERAINFSFVQTV